MAQRHNDTDDGTDEPGGDRPDIVQIERNIPFLGLTHYDDVDLPNVWGHGSSIRWWAEERWNSDGDAQDPRDIVPGVDGFATVIRDLPRAATAEAAWVHPATGETIRTGKHNAVVNPEVVEQVATRPVEEGGFEFDREYIGTVEEAREEWGDGWRQHVLGDDALYQIPTDDYTIVNPYDFLGPLARVVQDRGLEDAMFGEFRLFRSGGKGSGDILFNGEHVDVPGRSEASKPIVVGFQVDWDHFSGTAIHAQGMAMNYECVNAFRSITDEVRVKHTGDIEERTFEVGDHTADDWYEVWEVLFDLIDEKKDQLASIIEAAMSQNLEDLLELPPEFGDQFADETHPRLFALYKFMGYPGYLAEEAARDVHAQAADPANPTWWDIHSGATYAVTHHSRADAHAGSQVAQQMQTANDALFNPPLAAEAVGQAFAESRADDEEGLAEEGGGEATIVREQSVERAKEQYEHRQEEFQRLAPEMEGDD